MPNYNFLAPIEADIGICPSWGTWRQRYPLLGGQGRAGGRSTKNIYLDISHMPNYSFLAPIEVEIGICPSWGTEMWGSVFPLLGGLGIDLKYGGQLGSSY